MARRSRTFIKVPWNGGMNTSVDPAMLGDNDLEIADNVLFTTSGARIKREGIEELDTAFPVITKRASSTTTRKITFASRINDGVDDLFIIGEEIAVTTTVTSGNELLYVITSAAITAISTTDTTDDTIEYTAGASLTESATATSSLTVKRANDYIHVTDYWRTDTSNAKAQLIIAVTSQPLFFRYTVAGKRTEIAKDASATALTGPINTVSSQVVNDILVIAFDGATNTPKKYNPDTSANWFDLGGTPPNFSTMNEFQGRLWTNDKTDLDFIHYSPVGDPETWLGNGDSGGFPLSPGDGDSEGVKNIFKPYRGRLLVAKSTRIKQIVGTAPENYSVSDFVTGLGTVGENSSAPVDVDDIVFISERGIHSLSASERFGDLEGAFLSQKIQPTFDDWPPIDLENASAVYIPSFNSVAFAVTDKGSTKNSSIYFYNIALQEWFRWPNLNANYITTFLDSANTRRLMMAMPNSKVGLAQRGTFIDFAADPISYRVKTGTIYVDGNPDSIKGFKKLSLFYRPNTKGQITCKVRVDNTAVQTLIFEQTVEGARLDLDFILGTSPLGSGSTLAPFTQTIDNYGRGIVIELIQAGVDEAVSIYGIGIEYQSAGERQEVLSSA